MRPEKKELVSEIGNVLGNSSFLYFVSYKGLKVNDFSDFRAELSKNGAVCTVLKNRLIKKAAELADIDGFAALELIGDTAMISGDGDAGVVAKIVDSFAKKNAQVAAKGGYMDGSVLSVGDVKAIADLPSKEQMQAILLGVLQAPARNYVSVLSNACASIVNVVNNYKEKMEG